MINLHIIDALYFNRQLQVKVNFLLIQINIIFYRESPLIQSYSPILVNCIFYYEYETAWLNRACATTQLPDSDCWNSYYVTKFALFNCFLVGLRLKCTTTAPELLRKKKLSSSSASFVIKIFNSEMMTEEKN